MKSSSGLAYDTARLAHLMSLVPSHHNHAIGEKIGIRLEIDHLVAFPRSASVNGQTSS